MTDPSKKDLRDLTPDQLGQWLDQRGHQSYRLDQILRWLYPDAVAEVKDMNNLPTLLRSDLAEDFTLALPREIDRLESEDGAIKLAFELADGARVESVYMPGADRNSLCVSSQAGCRMGCSFCRTGLGGFRRQLTPAEIVGQALAVTTALGPIQGVVFMGMGEPLDNLDAVLVAIELLTDERCLAMSPGRLTVSTIGLVDDLARLARSAPRVRLALSLHSAIFTTRERLVPRTRVDRIERIRELLVSYPLGSRELITIEIALIGGVNDSVAEAHALVAWLAGLRVKVNLIPFNDFPGSDFKAPSMEAVLAYQEVIRRTGLKAFIRKSRGQDVLAACGQLGVVEMSNGDGVEG